MWYIIYVSAQKSLIKTDGKISRLRKFMALGLVWERAQSEKCQVLLLVSRILQKLNGEHAGIYDQTSSEMSQQKTILEP